MQVNDPTWSCLCIQRPSNDISSFKDDTWSGTRSLLQDVTWTFYSRCVHTLQLVGVHCIYIHTYTVNSVQGCGVCVYRRRYTTLVRVRACLPEMFARRWFAFANTVKSFPHLLVRHLYPYIYDVILDMHTFDSCADVSTITDPHRNVSH